ncbi:hypothetical protein CP8484711_1636B, partial [Chlamydia psittaci 84-8471/1]
ASASSSAGFKVSIRRASQICFNLSSAPRSAISLLPLRKQSLS